MKCPHCDVSIDEHEAGRETDACVAEAVMGDVHTYVTPTDFGVSGHWWQSKDRENYGHFPPDYSTDIAAAWEVVEKMGFYQLGSYQKGNVPVSHWAEFKDLVMEADTVQLAICRAALKAVAHD